MFLMHQLMDSVEIDTSAAGTTVTLKRAVDVDAIKPVEKRVPQTG